MSLGPWVGQCLTWFEWEDLLFCSPAESFQQTISSIRKTFGQITTRKLLFCNYLVRFGSTNHWAHFFLFFFSLLTRTFSAHEKARVLCGVFKKEKKTFSESLLFARRCRRRGFRRPGRHRHTKEDWIETETNRTEKSLLWGYWLAALTNFSAFIAAAARVFFRLLLTPLVRTASTASGWLLQYTISFVFDFFL